MKRVIALSLLLIVLLPLAAAAEGMKPGLWEITTTMKMPGMPFQPPPQTIKHCYTPEEASQAPVPTGDPKCKVEDIKQTGNTTSWTITCSGDAAGSGKGEITFSGDSAYSGKMEMTTQGMTMTSSYKGKRIGACK